MPPRVSPALTRRRWPGSIVGIVLQSAVVTALVHAAMAALDLWWPPLYTAAGALALFSLLEVRLQRRAAEQRMPAMGLAAALHARWSGSTIVWMSGLPVVRVDREDRWFAVHFETAGLNPYRLGITVGAWAPVPAWIVGRLPEDDSSREENRLRIKRRFYEVPLPDHADPRTLALSPEPGRTEAWLAAADNLERAQHLLFDNAPSTATLELFGDSVRWDTRLSARHTPDYVASVVDALIDWLPPIEWVADEPDVAPSSAPAG